MQFRVTFSSEFYFGLKAIVYKFVLMTLIVTRIFLNHKMMVVGYQPKREKMAFSPKIIYTSIV